MTVQHDTAGPGRAEYQSTKWTATVDGTSNYVYGTERTAVFATLAWDASDAVECSWLKFGSDEQTTLVLSYSAAITSYVIYPEGVATDVEIIGGDLHLTMPAAGGYLWVEPNGVRADALQVFARGLKSAVPGTVVDYQTDLALSVTGVNTGTDRLTITAHGLSNGDKVVPSLYDQAVDLPTGINGLTAYTVTVIDANTIELYDSLGDLVDLTTGGTTPFDVHKQGHATTTCLYFGPGHHTIGLDFELPTDGVVYIDRGAVLLGTFNLTDKTGVVIRGPGHITSGEHDTYATNVVRPWADRVTYAPFNGYGRTIGTTDNEVQEVTVFGQPFYLTVDCISRFIGVQSISPWGPNSDCWITVPVTNGGASEVTDCFSFQGDDNLQINGDFTRTLTVSGSFFANSGAACIHGGYTSFAVDQSTTVVTITDCHALHLAASTTAEPTASNHIIRAWSDGWSSESARGMQNVTLSGVDVWGPVGVIPVSLRNKEYPWGASLARDQFGQIHTWTWTNVVFHETPSALGEILGLDATNTPHDLTFTSLSFGGVLVTSANYETFLTVNVYPYNLTFGAIVVEPEVVTDASALWTAVVAAYPSQDLVSLTNIRDRDATTAVTAAGESAAQEVIDLWPLYAQVEYDSDNSTHVTVAKRGVIAVLWSRGGTAVQSAKIEWDEVFGDSGTISRVRRTGPRGRRGPVSNSEFEQPTGLAGARTVRPWSHPSSLPLGIMPNTRTTGYDS